MIMIDRGGDEEREPGDSIPRAWNRRLAEPGRTYEESSDHQDAAPGSWPGFEQWEGGRVGGGLPLPEDGREVISELTEDLASHRCAGHVELLLRVGTQGI
jgi:hypothetical protein